ncbi:uncharacterized protein LOC142768646 isoform X3 [Rhipicephalus microplus]
MTTLTSMFEMPDDTRIQCISSVTTAKNDDEHELLETVDYKNGTSEDWGKFSQAFEFLGESGEYNKMKLKEKNGAPSGLYTFLYASQDCGVMMVQDFKVHWAEAETGSKLSANDGSVQEDAGSAAPADQTPEKFHCMMWSRNDNENALQKFCEPYFNQCCQQRNRAYSYTPSSCTIPIERSDL